MSNIRPSLSLKVPLVRSARPSCRPKNLSKIVSPSLTTVAALQDLYSSELP